MNMTSIPRLSKILREIFVFDARLLAREEGVVQRKRIFDGASLAHLLVLGWVHHPTAGPSALARFAGGLGIRISKQGVQDRFTKEAAHWLHHLLMRAVQYVVCAGPVSIPMLGRFSAVVVEDGSTIALPDGL